MNGHRTLGPGDSKETYKRMRDNEVQGDGQGEQGQEGRTEARVTPGMR